MPEAGRFFRLSFQAFFFAQKSTAGALDAANCRLALWFYGISEFAEYALIRQFHKEFSLCLGSYTIFAEWN